ncbi:MAG: DUF3794 domain-containing protein [Ruminococcus sp.]|nr:DUF3794 domain-containing protein [Ruminococcus sp.]HRR76759.1 DUF3794 domain-containing protein [Ruminococcus sp.]
MELKINRETVPVSECIYEGVQEQTVELDYILPDYYPDIFRLIRCRVTPVITDSSVSGDKLNYELRCDIRILYCGEEDSVIRCVSQSQSFSRSVELGRNCTSPVYTLSPKTDHVNFRAVNKRRLDMRGAVSVRIKICGEQEQEVISDAFGMNIQLRKTPVRYASQRIRADKMIQISEETELSAAQPPVISILGIRCSAGECEKKMISGKLLAKGEVDIDLLYACEKEGEGAVEPLSFTLPYSQIIDIDGIDESFECRVEPEVISCEAVPAAGKDGENRLLRCETELMLRCQGVKTSTAMLVTDAYSTVYPCETETSEIRTEQIPVIYDESFRSMAKLAEGDSVPQTIYAMWCTPKNINTHISDDGRGLVVTGMLTYSMAAKDSSGMISMPDKDEAFEEVIALGDDVSGSSVSADISVREVSYNISPEGVLTAKADIGARISVTGSTSVKALTGLTADDSVRKERDGDYSIKLYFGVENEAVWDIAKRYSTSVAAVMEENELPGEKLESGGMLLIPIVT